MAIKLVHNVQTGEVSEVQMTKDELAQVKNDQANAVSEIAKAEELAKAKSELLKRLGITADEAAILLS